VGFLAVSGLTRFADDVRNAATFIGLGLYVAGYASTRRRGLSPGFVIAIVAVGAVAVVVMTVTFVIQHFA
jgi:tetrahydromethanopterin S-methyltransferase subunit F